MDNYKKYFPFFIPAIAVALSDHSQDDGTINIEWIGILILIIGIILLFELIEKSRVNRLKKWENKPPSKLTQMLKFSLFLGLPLSAIIIFIIHNKADFFYSVLFIALPLVLIFGWIGLLDWRSCKKIGLVEKYDVDL